MSTETKMAAIDQLPATDPGGGVLPGHQEQISLSPNHQSDAVCNELS